MWSLILFITVLFCGFMVLHATRAVLPQSVISSTNTPTSLFYYLIGLKNWFTVEDKFWVWKNL